MDFPVLSLLIVLPAAGALVVAVIPSSRRDLFLPVTTAITMIPFGVSVWILWTFEIRGAGLAIADRFQFTERVLWFDSLNISWNVGIDGMSLLLIMLTTFMFPISILASASIRKNIKMYMVLMLILESGLLGAFLALDLLLFFVFFEMTLLPMYLLIGIWGSENRIYAAVKFVIYTAAGSALMLTAIIWLAVVGGSAASGGGGPTFAFQDLTSIELSGTAQMWLFLAFAAAFAVKVPIFPFHTWLPDAHTEAPTAGSVLLAGVLLKLGTYGLLRFNLTLFPKAAVEAAPWIAALAVIGIVYGALVAIVQPDLKRLIAYTSVSHLGFIVLGTFALTSQGLQGGVIQMINHGLTTGALFLLVGMIYDRRKTRLISEYGGLGKVMPLCAGFFLFTALASVGLPGLNGFIGEFKVLIGSYLGLPIHAIVATLGVVLAAIYLLWSYERIFTGPIANAKNSYLADLNLREIGILVPVAALVLFLGLYPRPALDRIEPAVEAILERIESQTTFDVPTFGREVEVEAVGTEE